MQQILNTLYVTTPHSYAHLENDTLRIDVEREKKLQVPLHHLGAVVTFGNVLISPALMHRLADDGIALVLLDDNGRFKARLEGPTSGNVLLRQAQHALASDAQFSLETARAIVAGKLRNSRHVLLRGSRDARNDSDAESLSLAADSIANSIKRLPRTSTLDELRGIEGDAARNYFSAFNFLLRQSARDDFKLSGRNRRPPRDRINALLSFLYAVLLNDCRSALESVGLDPQIGFLHAVRPGRAALALDLMEEFRALLADRLALTLINREQLGPADFEERPGGAVMLGERGRRTVIVAYQERKKEELEHPLLETRLQIGLLPQVQARLLARTLRRDMEHYLPYLAR